MNYEEINDKAAREIQELTEEEFEKNPNNLTTDYVIPKTDRSE